MVIRQHLNFSKKKTLRGKNREVNGNTGVLNNPQLDTFYLLALASIHIVFSILFLWLTFGAVRLGSFANSVTA